MKVKVKNTRLAEYRLFHRRNDSHKIWLPCINSLFTVWLYLQTVLQLTSPSSQLLILRTDRQIKNSLFWSISKRSHKDSSCKLNCSIQLLNYLNLILLFQWKIRTAITFAWNQEDRHQANSEDSIHFMKKNPGFLTWIFCFLVPPKT